MDRLDEIINADYDLIKNLERFDSDYKWLIERAEKLKKIERVMGLCHADSFDRYEAIEEIKEIIEFY
jgi:hypothetical protein